MVDGGERNERNLGTNFDDFLLDILYKHGNTAIEIFAIDYRRCEP